MSAVEQAELEGFATKESPLATLLLRGLSLNPSEERLLRRLVSGLIDAVGQGHTGVPLGALTEEMELAREVLLDSGLCEEVLGAARASGAGEGKSTAPMILDGASRLYFRRYFADERELAWGLRRLVSEASAKHDAFVNELMGDDADPHQKEAVLGALQHQICVITGGPGTGKTRTVALILAALVRENRTRFPEVLLLAPTGKAASRMKESLLASMGQLELTSQEATRLAGSASTIHRALGYSGGGVNPFFRSAKNPLPADIVIVDEASMIDGSLMKSLVLALRPTARLILLGDVHQLASVDAGSVLRELAEFLSEPSSEKRGGAYVELKRSFRFSEGSSIYQLAAAIRTGDSKKAVRLLSEARTGEVALTVIDGRDLPENFSTTILDGFAPVFRSASPGEALARLLEFRVLMAHREGRFGVVQMNDFVQKRLSEAGLCPSHGEHYVGMPLLITENDPMTRLSNGDVGVVFRDEQGRLAAYFESTDGVRRVSLSELPKYEPAYAMTVHKSQGSEYSTIALVLPPAASPLLTRELFYTAVTRAKKKVLVWSEVESVVSAVEKFTARGSGLRDALVLVKAETSDKT